MRDIYLTDDLDEAVALVEKAIPGCADDEVEEIRSLGRTHRRVAYRDPRPPHHRRIERADREPKLCIKRVKRSEHGFRRFEHYRLGVLLHAGSVTWPRPPAPPRIRSRPPSGA